VQIIGDEALYGRDYIVEPLIIVLKRQTLAIQEIKLVDKKV
jgi:hypothetical protein